MITRIKNNKKLKHVLITHTFSITAHAFRKLSTIFKENR